MEYAVTGGAGFIGSNIVKLLIREGHTVKVLDNLVRGNLQNLSGVKDQIDFKKIDILDYLSIKKELSGVDGVFHQAALTSVPESFAKPQEYQKVNVLGTENIFSLAKEMSFKVVYASSSNIYGNPKKIPIREDFEKKPINPYGVTKLEDENLATKYYKVGARIIGLRYFNVYGKGQTPDYAGVITKFLERLKQKKSPIVFGDGKQVRDFVFVEDVAQANLVAMTSDVNCDFFNVGTGIATSLNNLANLMINLSGMGLEPQYAELPEGDVRLSQADTQYTLKRINWKATTALKNGLGTFFTQ